MRTGDTGTARIDQVFAAALAATRAGEPTEAVRRYDEVLGLLGEPLPQRASPFTILGRRPGTAADPATAPPGDERSQQLIVILQEMASVLRDADPPRAHEARRRAIELAEQAGDLDALGVLYTDEARQRLSEIDRDGADAYARAAAKTFARPTGTAGHGRGRVLAARYALDRGDLVQSFRHVLAVLSRAEPRSTPFHEASLLGATIDLLYDRPGLAIERAETARDGAQRAGSTRLATLLDAARGAALCLTGRADEGDPLIAAAREAVIQKRWTSDDVWVTVMERLADRILGRTAAARTILKLSTLSNAAPFLARLGRTLTAGVLLGPIDAPGSGAADASAERPKPPTPPAAELPPTATPAARRAATRRARAKKAAEDKAAGPPTPGFGPADLELARRTLAEAADSPTETPYLRVKRRRLEAVIGIHERGPHEAEALRAVATECVTLGLLGERARALVALGEARTALRAPTTLRRQPLEQALQALETLANSDRDVGLPGLLARTRTRLDALPAPFSHGTGAPPAPFSHGTRPAQPAFSEEPGSGAAGPPAADQTWIGGRPPSAPPAPPRRPLPPTYQSPFSPPEEAKSAAEAPPSPTPPPAAASSTAPPSHRQGRLENTPLAKLLQELAAKRTSGRLEILPRGRGAGLVVVRDGAPIRARFEDLTDVDAIAGMLSETTGVYRVAEMPIEEAAVALSVDSLLEGPGTPDPSAPVGVAEAIQPPRLPEGVGRTSSFAVFVFEGEEAGAASAVETSAPAPAPAPAPGPAPLAPEVEVHESAALLRKLTVHRAAYVPAPEDRERRQLQLIVDLSNALGSILELEPLLEKVLDCTLELTGAQLGFLALFEEPRDLSCLGSPGEAPPGNGLRIRVTRCLEEADLEGAAAQVSQSVVRAVEQSGEPLLVPNAAEDERFSRAQSLVGYLVRSLLAIPLRTARTYYGLVFLETRAVDHPFEKRDLELCLPFAAQAATAIESARAFERIRELYETTLATQKARERVLNHLSHELRTPLAVLDGLVTCLERGSLPPDRLQRALERGKRGLDRLSGISRAVSDICAGQPGDPDATAADLVGRLIADLLDEVAAADPGSADVATLARVSRQLDERLATLLPNEAPSALDPTRLLVDLREAAQTAAADRAVEVALDLGSGLRGLAPSRPLQLTLAGLLRNAIESTPDEGRVRVGASMSASTPPRLEIVVHDEGVGISRENQAQVFGGFFHTQETSRHASKTPYTFDARGKGLDLLRAKVFAERYGWTLDLESERCRFIPADGDTCPGRISACTHCAAPDVCRQSGFTRFMLTLPTE